MYTKVNYDPVQCRYCGVDFNPNRKDKRFCTKNHSRKYYRNKYREHKKPSCEVCGFVPVLLIQLDVDHIDGNHNNNDISNLQTLCANCHRLKSAMQLNWHQKKTTN